MSERVDFAVMNRSIPTLRSQNGRVGSVLTQTPDEIGRTAFYGAHYQTTDGGLGGLGGGGVGFGSWKFPLKYQLAVQQKQAKLSLPIVWKVGATQHGWATGLTANDTTTIVFMSTAQGSGTVTTAGPSTDAQGNIPDLPVTFGTNLSTGGLQVTVKDSHGKSVSVIGNLGASPIQAFLGWLKSGGPAK